MQGAAARLKGTVWSEEGSEQYLPLNQLGIPGEAGGEWLVPNGRRCLRPAALGAATAGGSSHSGPLPYEQSYKHGLLR